MTDRVGTPLRVGTSDGTWLGALVEGSVLGNDESPGDGSSLGPNVGVDDGALDELGLALG